MLESTLDFRNPTCYLKGLFFLPLHSQCFNLCHATELKKLGHRNPCREGGLLHLKTFTVITSLEISIRHEDML